MSVQEELLTSNQTVCYHCGEDLGKEQLDFDNHLFCCQGCKTVYDILKDNGLGNYYDLESSPGLKVKEVEISDRFAFLDNPKIQQKLLNYADDQLGRVIFFIPTIHCSSCIWLLENLYKLQKGIRYSRVNFMKKELSLDFDPSILSLRQLLELLTSIGYEPNISLSDDGKPKKVRKDRSLYIKIGVAGFCFGNIMMLSFPEYFGFEGTIDNHIRHFITYINLVLSLPIIFYCSSDYFISAWKSLRQAYINIDVPISLGILVLFLRSAIEVLWNVGPGYFDSLAGLLFFLLVGKWFQQKTYDSISFDRDYKSYFPLAISRMKGEEVENVPVNDLKVGDEILVRNRELIPADGILVSQEARIDYSFVTGEAEPDSKSKGDYIYAGGRQLGQTIRLIIQKEVSQSYLTSLWNSDVFVKEGEDQHQNLINRISKYFTLVVLVIAFLAATFWWIVDSRLALQVFTAVLIVACPCALALSTPFTLGSISRLFGRHRLYLKNSHVMEKLASIDSIVFDKTGTITDAKDQSIHFEGVQLDKLDKQLIQSLVSQSTHPLSRKIDGFLKQEGAKGFMVEHYIEEEGQGISGRVNGIEIRLGKLSYVALRNNSDRIYLDSRDKSTSIYVAFEKETRGRFLLSNSYRKGLKPLVDQLKNYFSLALISGDNNGEKETLASIFPPQTDLQFKQSPSDKLEYIRKLQQKGKKVLMVGDGLNDAGALKQSDVGIAVTGDIMAFSPACDAILDASRFEDLFNFIRLSLIGKRIIIASFVISFLYNIVGLMFAVSGNLSPVFAAVLMPLSSLTVVIFTSGMAKLMGSRYLKS
ncbi:heavy metal translocating P-type ATPase [Xanthovirga aplysinae]|uniref:heavy metal translocating P-type ATPase n=1 Tax=Xanthovirga aplysinae TaxID=2529853 RepID=UPI0012BD3453|nr:heavy metal translocating P-type ATPase metal-binding domain-containing protein [Xanthovirga aplysinae]MTI30902.1 HAD family hydrolase [Xanthovirga aplysinae]